MQKTNPGNVVSELAIFAQKEAKLDPRKKLLYKSKMVGFIVLHSKIDFIRNLEEVQNLERKNFNIA